MKKFFALLMISILFIGAAYCQPDLSERNDQVPVEYDVGYDYATTICSLSNILCEPEATHIEVPRSGANDLGIVSYGLARSCDQLSIYNFLSLSHPLYPCPEPDEYNGLCRNQLTNTLYTHIYGLAQRKQMATIFTYFTAINNYHCTYGLSNIC